MYLLFINICKHFVTNVLFLIIYFFNEIPNFLEKYFEKYIYFKTLVESTPNVRIIINRVGNSNKGFT